MSIFPMIQPKATTSIGNLPLYREVAWDYNANQPVFRRGEPVIVTGKEAVKVWIYKSILTSRYRYEIYTKDYGSEFEGLIGQAYTPALKEAEAPRYLRECLLINPYITDVKNIEVSFSDGTLTVSGIAETVYGEVKFHVVT